MSRSVFFNLFAAAEPFANICVAHGTLCCNGSSIYPTFCNKHVEQWYCQGCSGVGTRENGVSTPLHLFLVWALPHLLH